MYDSPTSMDFDSEFSPQSIYDDRDSLNNSFGGRNRQLSTNIRYMEEEEDEINRSHNRRNNNNYNNSNSNRSVNLGGAYVENERRANAVNFERLVNEVGLHELFRNICVDILVQKQIDLAPNIFPRIQFWNELVRLVEEVPKAIAMQSRMVLEYQAISEVNIGLF